MCWIFAYRWPDAATPILMRGLQKLEYRGYDSAGIALMDTTGKTHTIKAVGKVADLQHTIDQQTANTDTDPLQQYTRGIAHTRRATHGKPTMSNTHPHCDAGQKFFVVHNGIIENQRKLKNELIDEGYMFYGDTDTEVIPALLAKHWTWSLRTTVHKVLPLLHGAYALVIISTHAPDEMIGVTLGSPLFLWMTTAKDRYFFSSDAQALSGVADELIHIADNEVVHLTWDTYTVFAHNKPIEKAKEEVRISAEEVSKGKYKHFMLKEIYEQAAIMQRICKGRVHPDTHQLMAEAFHGMQQENYTNIVLVGCGTSYNAWLTGAWWLERIANISAKAEIASEYITKRIPVDPQTLHIFLSQSWETADTIEVLKHIQERGGKTFGIVNSVWSTIARLTDHGLFMRAGHEVGVASTKAFTGMITCLFLVTLFLAKRRWLALSEYKHLINELLTIPQKINEIVADTAPIQEIAKQISTYGNMFYLWRGALFSIAAEGSLKMKEISYIHSEAYPAGELKHGPLALIDPHMCSVLIAPDDAAYQSNMSTLAEIKARSGRLCVIWNRHHAEADRSITVPTTHELLTPIITNVALQLVAYYTALELQREIDKPRNLAKSVTVK